jgi:hypothetical protein
MGVMRLRSNPRGSAFVIGYTRWTAPRRNIDRRRGCGKKLVSSKNG